MEWVVKPNVSGGLMGLLDFQPNLRLLHIQNINNVFKHSLYSINFVILVFYK